MTITNGTIAVPVEPPSTKTKPVSVGDELFSVHLKREEEEIRRERIESAEVRIGNIVAILRKKLTFTFTYQLGGPFT